MADKKRLELIDRNALMKNKTILWDEALGYSDCVLVEDIDNAPTVDAVEVAHGWWLNSHTIALTEECSQCGFCVPWDDDGMLHKYNYCPNCGAKMDGDGNETV